jgi:hypothetical protein
LKEGDNFGRTRRRFEDNIEMGLKEISWEEVDCVPVAKDRDTKQKSNFRFHKMWGYLA